MHDRDPHPANARLANHHIGLLGNAIKLPHALRLSKLIVRVVVREEKEDSADHEAYNLAIQNFEVIHANRCHL